MVGRTGPIQNGRENANLRANPPMLFARNVKLSFTTVGSARPVWIHPRNDTPREPSQVDVTSWSAIAGGCFGKRHRDFDLE